MAKKQKYYVVWNGVEDGIFTSWDDCRRSVEGYPGAKYKSFKSEAEAAAAWEAGPDSPVAKGEATDTATLSPDTKPSVKPKAASEAKTPPAVSDWNAIAVDAACSGNPGKMEYRGVYLRTGKEIFHSKVMWGTNNIGEFLAIVHGLALLKQKGLDTMPIYSDSVNAQLWVRRRKCKTTLERNEKTEELYKIIERAEAWLQRNTYANPIVKWPTDLWGEIPADFGRK